MFERHYDINDVGRQQKGVFGISGVHGPEDGDLRWVLGVADQRRSEIQEKKRMDELQRIQTDSFFDLSGYTKPMPIFLRHRFRQVFYVLTFLSQVFRI